MAEWVRVGSLDDLPDDRGARVQVEGRMVALFRVEDDVYAIDDTCSHAEASLAEGELWDYEVECPRHGSEFDVRTGAPHSLPATRPVPVYPVKVQDGDVFVLPEPEGGQ